MKNRETLIITDSKEFQAASPSSIVRVVDSMRDDMVIMNILIEHINDPVDVVFISDDVNLHDIAKMYGTQFIQLTKENQS